MKLVALFLRALALLPSLLPLLVDIDLNREQELGARYEPLDRKGEGVKKERNIPRARSFYQALCALAYYYTTLHRSSNREIKPR